MAKLRGTGLAAVNYPTGMHLGGDPTQSLIHMTPAGDFVVTMASVDLGQGLRTVLAQIAAETLGVPYESIHVETADTDTGPHCTGTFASRTTHRAGNAVVMAAQEARKAMLEVRGRAAGGQSRRSGDRRRRHHPHQGCGGTLGLGRRGGGCRSLRPGQDHRRARRLPQAAEPDGPGDRRVRPGFDPGPCLHRGRGGGRYRDREGRGARREGGLRGRPAGQPRPGEGPDRRRRLDGHRPRALRDHRARLPGDRPGPGGFPELPPAGTDGDARGRVRGAGVSRRRAAPTAARASARWSRTARSRPS